MISESNALLLPSRALKNELQELQERDPRIGELAREKPFVLTEDALTFAVDEAGERVYAMVAIPVPERSGRLFIGQLPGRRGPVEREVDAIVRFGISRIVCLLPEEDVKDPRLYNVPGYVPLGRERFGERFHLVEVIDYEAPGNDEAFEKITRTVDEALSRGEAVLAHCGAGCGRAGAFAACLLVTAGLDPIEAVRLVRKHRGCGPESADQVAYVVRFARRRQATP